VPSAVRSAHAAHVDDALLPMRRVRPLLAGPAHRRSARRRLGQLDALIARDAMLMLTGLVIVVVAAVVIPRLRVPGLANSAPLGWMSERWVAEHRISHSA